MDQRFSARSNANETCEKTEPPPWRGVSSNRCGMYGGDMVLGPKWSQFSGARIIVLTLAGGALLSCGLATVISPPSAEYKSAANKQRNAVLGMIGLALGAVELYFYNDIYGIW